VTRLVRVVALVGASGVREAVALGGERDPLLIRREPVDGDTLWYSVGKYSCGLSESSWWSYAGRGEACEEFAGCEREFSGAVGEPSWKRHVCSVI